MWSGWNAPTSARQWTGWSGNNVDPPAGHTQSRDALCALTLSTETREPPFQVLGGCLRQFEAF